jgi:hypothetical protein
MTKVLPFNPLKRQRLTSLLGLSLDGSRLEGVELKRTNGSLQLVQAFSVTLSLDPLTAAPELVGREIRNHLAAAGVREKRCVAAVPLKWALIAHTKLPELAEDDRASFLQLEAERAFPCDVATLMLATSICRTAGGEEHATLIGVPRNQVELLEGVLRAAQLRPISFSLGLPGLQPADLEGSKGVMAFLPGEAQVGLQITSGGGIAALRTLEGAFEQQGTQRVLRADVVARETRITLGQLPAELRSDLRRVRVFGPRDQAQPLADELELRLEAMGLKVELADGYDARQFGVTLPAGAPVSAAFSLAGRHLAGKPATLEFLPPKVRAWQQAASRYLSGKYRTVGAVAAAASVLIGGAFLLQQWQLARLQATWQAMQKQVRELEATQQRIRQYRPWFDETARTMSILRQLTAAFPEDGAVTAKTVEIRDPNTVSCTGVARDNASLLRTLDKLRASSSVADIKVDRLQGRSPMQFTFDFRWVEGGAHAN